MLPFSTEALLGYLAAARGPAVPGASPPPRSRHLLGFGSLCLLLLCSFGILFVFS